MAWRLVERKVRETTPGGILFIRELHGCACVSCGNTRWWGDKPEEPCEVCKRE